MQLSKAQQEAVNLLEAGLFIWTNEGARLRAWIGDESGNKVKRVHVKTALSLSDKQVIGFVDGSYRPGIFKYALVK